VAAERLAAAGVVATVLEAAPEPGGACRSVAEGDFSFDFTGHLLHVNRPETAAYLEGIGVWPQLAVHQRRAAVDVAGEVTPYPIQINTHGLAAEVRRDCVLGFVRAWAAADGAREEAGDFAAWVLSRFGEGFARHFFFPYNRKLYRAEPAELSTDWLGRYVPKPGLEDVVNGAFGLYRSAVGYNATFRYPARGGIRLLPDAVAARVPDLRCGHEVVALSLAERWVETGDGQRFAFEHLVFTGSLPRLVELLVAAPPAAVVEARAALRWVRVVNLALGVRGPAPRHEHWLYYPDADLPFYRVGIPSNHGALAPPDCHTLSVEASLDPGPGDVAGAGAAMEAALVARGLLDPTAVVVRRLLVVDPAYVVFDHRRRRAVAVLRRFFAAAGVLLAGRWAEWKYSAMEDAVLDGLRVARRLGPRCGPA
jgi:protoporphyrinogen oxidase